MSPVRGSDSPPPPLRGSHVPAAAGNADMFLQAECASMRGPVLPQLRAE